MTVQDNKVITVRNLMNHTVGYKIEEDHIRRMFSPYEKKQIKAGEIRKACYQYGCKILFNDFLSIQDKELAFEIGVPEDAVEYWWTQEDVDRMLTQGSMDELLDALDFAPKGIKDMIVDRAVELKLNDMNKREAIQTHTGFNITAMINLKEQYNAGIENEAPAQQRRRRVQQTSSEKEGRRVAH